ncbi:unnamed protein product [Symbiodinium sp. CCMP2456]|nr:unnamed protein product [Symbiodinium sp. CCMP2456]
MWCPKVRPAVPPSRGSKTSLCYAFEPACRQLWTTPRNVASYHVQRFIAIGKCYRSWDSPETNIANRWWRRF